MFVYGFVGTTIDKWGFDYFSLQRIFFYVIYNNLVFESTILLTTDKSFIVCLGLNINCLNPVFVRRLTAINVAVISRRSNAAIDKNAHLAMFN